MNLTPGLSVIVPSKNEEESLPKLCQQVAAAMGDNPYEIIIVNDHSTDGTQQQAVKLGRKFPVKLHNLSGITGKSAGVIAGVQEASYEIAAFIDADLQFTPAVLPEMLRLIGNNKADVVVANRIIKKGSYQPSRYARTRNFLYRHLLGLKCDVQTGLKAFRKEYMLDLCLLINNPWSLDAQFLLKSRLDGAKISGVTITYDDRQGGETKNHKRRLNAYSQIFEAVYLWWLVRVMRRSLKSTR